MIGKLLAAGLGEPKDMVGVGFTMFFAQSRDLKDWKVIDGAAMGKDRYTGAPMLRYFGGWFYFFHLERDNGVVGKFVTRVMRSRDLRKWELSPKVVLGYDDDDRRLHPLGRFTTEEKARIAAAKNVNASDLDMCEYGGRLRMFYSWGDQNGNEFSALAEADCTECAFCESFFTMSAKKPVETDLTTVWGEKVTAANVWRDYPRPQMIRSQWDCLNGNWQYAITETQDTCVLPTVGKRRVSFLGEFGGLGWRVEGHVFDPRIRSWGYDGAVDKDKTSAYLELMKSLEGFVRRGLGGSVYTQTTDVEGEINGLMTYDRKGLKYDAATLRAAHEKIRETVR